MQGAEAVITLREQCIKARIPKRYRIAEIDTMLRRRRTKGEARLLRAALRAGVAVPQVIEEKETELVLERIDGRTVTTMTREEMESLASRIGDAISALHRADIVHGDLTTSNMILGGKLYIIDFGLSFFSRRPEDKANDLHAMAQALDATHPGTRAADIILKTYREKYAGAGPVLTSLAKIRKRRRYR